MNNLRHVLRAYALYIVFYCLFTTEFRKGTVANCEREGCEFHLWYNECFQFNALKNWELWSVLTLSSSYLA